MNRPTHVVTRGPERRLGVGEAGESDTELSIDGKGRRCCSGEVRQVILWQI